VGTCPADQVAALSNYVNISAGTGPHKTDYSKFHCLCNTKPEGLFGLGDWAHEQIDQSGNLAERDYGVQDVFDELVNAVRVAPGLDLKVHCGGEREDAECICTITVRGGAVSKGPPEITLIRGVTGEEAAGRMALQLSGMDRF
jgi:hypothetical protein